MEMKSKLTKSKGNMYGWVTHTHSHIGGECSHQCEYCYVQATKERSSEKKELYSGDIRIIEGSLDVDYGTDKVIFIDHMNDLFAEGVPDSLIIKVLSHCLRYPTNKYVFQTKNPVRYATFEDMFLPSSILGTTIESDIIHDCMGKAPKPWNRVSGMMYMANKFQTFITLEPILRFLSPVRFARMILHAKPTFVNIGADSKRHDLDEPSFEEVMELYQILIDNDIEVRKKINLERLEHAKHKD